MIDEEIVKALRCCADRYCKGCSMQGKANCRETVAALSWDIINRQKAEIERLKREAVIDANEIKCTRIHRDRARVEAIKEFAEKVDEFTIHTIDDEYVSWKFKFDRLVEEMVGSE